MHRCAVLLFFVTSFSLAVDTTVVYTCVHPDGSLEYRNTGGGKDCAKVPDYKNYKESDSKAWRAVITKSKQIRKESWQRLSLGMTKADVEKTWNKPNKEQVRRVQTRNGVTEEWRFPGNGKLTFQDDMLEAIED
jgi:hypothetical protein